MLPMKEILKVIIAGLFVLTMGACVHEGAKVDEKEISLKRSPAPIGAMCGGVAGIKCAGDNAYCAMDVGTCRIDDGAGICRMVKPICTREYSPVCGCDGTTYSNSCTAQAAGANILHTGACST